MIHVKNLRFSYPGADKETLRGLDFSIRQGEIFGFLGPSGAGKSTLQKILIGILKPYKGSVNIFDEEIAVCGPDYYERIGVAFEFPNFYSKFTALENLKLFKALYQCRTEDPMIMLEKVGLSDASELKVSQLSKGMKMRLNFCRSCMHHPDLLFLDEPTSGLDPVNAQILKELIIEQKAEGKTIILTTHNMHTAEELCDRVAFIVDGCIKLIDSPRALKLRQGQRKVQVDYLKDQVKVSEQFAMKDIGTNERFLQILRNYEIETIHSQEASMEQIFIDVTGRTLT